MGRSKCQRNEESFGPSECVFNFLPSENFHLRRSRTELSAGSMQQVCQKLKVSESSLRELAFLAAKDEYQLDITGGGYIWVVSVKGRIKFRSRRVLDSISECVMFSVCIPFTLF